MSTHNVFIEINQRTNGPVAHLRLFILSKLMVTFLKNETYGYDSWYILKTFGLYILQLNLRGQVNK